MGGLSYLKRFLQVLLFSFPAVLSCLLIHCLLTFSALPHCPRAWLRLKLSVMTIHRNFNWGLSWGGGGGERTERKDLGKCKTTSCVSPVPSHSWLPPLFRLQNFKHCCIFSSYYFPTISTLLEPLATLSSPTFRTCPTPVSWAWASDTMSSPT